MPPRPPWRSAPAYTLARATELCEQGPLQRCTGVTGWRHGREISIVQSMGARVQWEHLAPAFVLVHPWRRPMLPYLLTLALIAPAVLTVVIDWRLRRRP